ncbi:MAG: fasciclin domain-containing protein [Granulosicoccus sp.]
MRCKLHVTAVFVLVLATACSESFSTGPQGTQAPGANTSEMTLTVPPAIANARAVDPALLYARVTINGSERILAPGDRQISFSADEGDELVLIITWFESRSDDANDDLRLAEREVRQTVTDSAEIVVDDYFTDFDDDNDGISNLDERNADTDPTDPDDPEDPVDPPVRVTTAFDVIAASSNHQTFEDLLVANNRVSVLDDSDPDNQVTIFAPTDAAFAALPAGMLDSLSANDTFRLLNHHVVNGAVQSGDLASELVPPANEYRLATLAAADPAQFLVFTSGDAGINITDGSGNLVPLDGALDLNAPTQGEMRTGIVHVINNVLMPEGFAGEADEPNVSIPRIDAVMAPTIDGLYDQIWTDGAEFDDVNDERLAVDNLMIDQGALQGNGEAQFRWFAMHDDINLYVYVLGRLEDITTPIRDSADFWDDDSVNVFVDGDNSKGTAYDGVDDRHLVVPLLTDPENLTANTTVFMNGPNSTSAPSFEFATCFDCNGEITWELKLPLSEFNISKGEPFGFEIQVDVDSDGGERDARWGWFHPARTTVDVDNTWTMPSFMGTAIIVD